MHWMLQRLLDKNANQLQIITDYEAWVMTAKPKARFVYYKGLTPAQTFVGQAIKERVYQDYKRGLVLLVTKRMGDHNFNYLAIRTSKKVEDAYDK